jgi:FlaA1/EpsC-like NDP-sugar epimerase
LLELQGNYPFLKLIPIIADIRNDQRLDSVFKMHQPQIVFHAAAHKHVPLMEANPVEAVSNNVFGTRNLVQAALVHGVERFVLISTDKAVRPSSIYGATKRLAEMIVLDAAHQNNRAFTVVRFGNVLGSRGSIIPIFKNQIANGGPITITHPNMARFFMTIPEAVYLVLQASSMQGGGEVFVLNMGEPVRILDLAVDLIKLSGLEPHKDIEITFTGIRPGEKLTEELWESDTALIQTPHPDVFRLDQDSSLSSLNLIQAIDQLTDLSLSENRSALTQLLDRLIPGSTITASQPSDLQPLILDL